MALSPYYKPGIGSLTLSSDIVTRGDILPTSGGTNWMSPDCIVALSELIEWCGGPQKFLEIFKQIATPLKNFMDQFGIENKDLAPPKEEELLK